MRRNPALNGRKNDVRRITYNRRDALIHHSIRIFFVTMLHNDIPLAFGSFTDGLFTLFLASLGDYSFFEDLEKPSKSFISSQVFRNQILPMLIQL